MRALGHLGILLILSQLIFPALLFAADTADLVLVSASVKFSSSTFLEGKAVRIYASVTNLSSSDVRGVVRFFDGQYQIQGDQPVSVISGRDDSVFVDWAPGSPGDHAIRITVTPFEKTDSNMGNNSYTKTVQVLADTDHDGKPNTTDPDDDNDGVPDLTDAFPLNKNESKDTDGDTIGDNKDDDDDNDGVKDVNDALPLDPTETADTDKDTIGDNKDTDDDSDGILDVTELQNGTDPLKTDTDGDGVNDNADAFPLDATKAHDYDHDGITDAQDQDADSDGIPKSTDVDDTNLGPIIKVTSNAGTPSRFVFPGEAVQFESSQSEDPDGQITKATWTIDGISQEGAEIKTFFNDTGSHVVQVKLTDNKGESREQSFRLYVIPPYLPWIAISLFLLLIILALFFIFSYSKPRRSRFEGVISTLEVINKALPKAKKRRQPKKK